MADETSLSLIRRVQSNSRDGWNQLVSMYEPLVRRWLRRSGVDDDDVADITQDVLATVVREVGAFKHSGRPGAWRAWLRQITVHRARRHFSRRKPANHGDSVHAFLAQMDDPNSELSNEWDQEHDRHVVTQLLRAVDDEFQPAARTVFWRTFIEGAAPADVAAELNMSLAAVYTAKSRVLAFLRREAEGILELAD